MMFSADLTILVVSGINEVWRLWKCPFTYIQSLKVLGKKSKMADIFAAFAPILLTTWGSLNFVFRLCSCKWRESG